MREGRKVEGVEDVGGVGSGKRRSNINYKQIKNRSGRVLESVVDDDICRITDLTSSNVYLQTSIARAIPPQYN